MKKKNSNSKLWQINIPYACFMYAQYFIILTQILKKKTKNEINTKNEHV